MIDFCLSDSSCISSKSCCKCLSWHSKFSLLAVSFFSAYVLQASVNILTLSQSSCFFIFHFHNKCRVIAIEFGKELFNFEDIRFSFFKLVHAWWGFCFPCTKLWSVMFISSSARITFASESLGIHIPISIFTRVVRSPRCSISITLLSITQIVSQNFSPTLLVKRKICACTEVKINTNQHQFISHRR